MVLAKRKATGLVRHPTGGYQGHGGLVRQLRLRKTCSAACNPEEDTELPIEPDSPRGRYVPSLARAVTRRASHASRVDAGSGRAPLLGVQLSPVFEPHVAPAIIGDRGPIPAIVPLCEEEYIGLAGVAIWVDLKTIITFSWKSRERCEIGTDSFGHGSLDQSVAQLTSHPRWEQIVCGRLSHPCRGLAVSDECSALHWDQC